MRILTVVSLAFILSTLTGCQSSQTINVITFHPTDYEVTFIPDQSNRGEEYMYKDAFIDLKAKYPKAFDEMKTGKKAASELTESIHSGVPALIISKNGQTITELSGEIPKQKIVEQLEMTMN
ncbi:hypothetical protein [Lentibacillus sediminis]|uniref:hypothetical protein n=1 Tax=Lentibacillus sediminis TaxID=1940529 RepID=UPI00117AD46D|nr:hypothetical protein [Lentibacillus sediminis]